MALSQMRIRLWWWWKTWGMMMDGKKSLAAMDGNKSLPHFMSRVDEQIRIDAQRFMTQKSHSFKGN
jgi:hypothetical protein